LEPLVIISNFVNPAHENFLLKIAFIPGDNALYTSKLENLRNNIYGKLPVLQQVNETLNTIQNSPYESGEWAGVKINFQGMYGLNTVTIIDPSYINYVAPKVKFWLSGLMVFCTCMWTLNRVSSFWNR
jgi:hypothetical protein